ncbi:unnamed protein product [Ilex paraguariensis]|uniref:UDP-glycosyltransferases domain-containing protein n=1 Tax=Ilex paraguariensis TaxID=185542 RepID=A0ABC8T8G3_9AQUA
MGDPQLPVGFSEGTKDQGLMVQWSPQTKVLAHQSVGCFLSHCGWNSLLEAITAGVPVLAYPKWTDQPTNAKLIVDVLRVGVRLRPDKEGVVSSEEVEKCIEEIMSGPSSEEYHKNATKLKRAAREAVAHLAGISSGSWMSSLAILVHDAKVEDFPEAIFFASAYSMWDKT